MADYSKLTKRELIMTLYARDLMLENERKRLEHLTEKYFELKQQLHDLPKKIVEEIKGKLHDRLSKIAGYGRMTSDEFSFFVENEFTKDIDTILKKFGAEDE